MPAIAHDRRRRPEGDALPARAIPVVCDRAALVGRPLLEVHADGAARLRVTTAGAELGGWAVTWPQLILALQDAAQGVKYGQERERATP